MQEKSGREYMRCPALRVDETYDEEAKSLTSQNAQQTESTEPLGKT